MKDELTVHVNREDLHSLDVPASFHADGDFDVVFINHGQAVRTHLHLDDELSEVASLKNANPQIASESKQSVRVSVNQKALAQESIVGKLKLASGYGVTTRWVNVELTPPEKDSEEVPVEESMIHPPESNTNPTGTSVLRQPELVASGLGIISLIVAIISVLVFKHLVVLLGSFAVMAAVLFALFLLISD